MVDFENCKMIKLSESNRYILRELLEERRSEVTVELFDETNKILQDHLDIMILEIDEILEAIGEE